MYLNTVMAQTFLLLYLFLTVASLLVWGYSEWRGLVNLETTLGFLDEGPPYITLC